ncbi:methyltransferase domain-containing protein [Mucilaginibacter sp. HMF5004]|uniref:class I SAM-dependent methyltransferase n=1 Tax=Mucilaginibacter rivuli TaxID=2857527 RepID=UPI001C5CE5D2|nr:class I SAM-dependent methyltransferase [Mucilaginibacter rivuli]MBW4891737.1 methyltransferase domain-containing protein [Mucilaginibacter rivuli]
MSDILGQAIYKHYHKLSRQKLWINNRYGPREEMPLGTYFRTEDDMPDMEWLALNECRGKVLDIGAAAGCHSLILQERRMDVTAMDISPLAVDVMKEQGIKKAVLADIFSYNQGKFDTLLLLMNGIGLAGTIIKLKQLLLHLTTLLNPGGQILFDSSDIAYLYEGQLPQTGYYGEIWYQYEYGRQKTEWFQWLYVDEATMQAIATETGFKMDVLLEDEFGQYLTRLTLV